MPKNKNKYKKLKFELSKTDYAMLQYGLSFAIEHLNNEGLENLLYLITEDLALQIREQAKYCKTKITDEQIKYIGILGQRFGMGKFRIILNVRLITSKKNLKNLTELNKNEAHAIIENFLAEEKNMLEEKELDNVRELQNFRNSTQYQKDLQALKNDVK